MASFLFYEMPMQSSPNFIKRNVRIATVPGLNENNWMSTIPHESLIWCSNLVHLWALYTTCQGRIQDFWRGGGVHARIQDFLKGGGGDDIHKHTPLGHCPRDVIRPPKNWKTPPLLDIHKHPPLDIVRVTSSTLRGVIGPSHAHFAWVFSIGTSSKGGGWSPLSPPLDPPCTGVHLRSTGKKGGGGPRGGPTLGPMLKSLHRGPKGGSGPPGKRNSIIARILHYSPDH